MTLTLGSREMATYKIVRFYKDWKISKRKVQGGLTLEQARSHCEDPETSSSTCTSRDGIRRTQSRGAWFDGYDTE
jgi:hypothetical protein